MKRGVVVLIGAAAVVAGFLLGRNFPPCPAPWVPVLEETGFEYLDAAVARLSAGVTALSESGEGTPEILAREVRRLRYYYVPLTQVRQWVYDADRLLYLGDREGARRNLVRAKEAVRSGTAAAGEGVRRSLEEVAMMVDRILLGLDDGAESSPARFRELGHRVNLMLLRGEMELSGEDFLPPQ